MSGEAPTYTRAAQLLGAPGLLSVVHDAVDQVRLRGLYDRLSAGRGPRAARLDKEGLTAVLVRLALADEGALGLLAKELSRAATREKGLVDALEENALRERILALPALQLRRERARIMWALSMDPRPGAQRVAEEMVGALLQALGDARAIERTAIFSPEAVSQKVEDLEAQTRAVERQAEGMASQVNRLEKERAEFLAQLGAKEAQLRDEVDARAESDREASLANTRVRELEVALEESRAEVARLRAEERLGVDAGAWETRLQNAQRRLETVTAERDALQKERDAAVSQLHRMQDEQRTLAGALASRDQVAQERIRRLREMLRDARKQRHRAQGQAAATTTEGTERIAVHVDVANLSAGAHHHQRGRMDFVSMLNMLAAGRSVARAVAYAVEQGEPEKFQGFCMALRGAGFEVRVKKPVTRADGSVKADWDMGLAMDVVEDTARVDTVVLCSGDGDFVPLVQLMRRRGKRVEVAAFRADAHDDLLRIAHAFHPLGAELVIR
ncbi:MAG: NYN domain-containing protein [Myxococcota bacterium]